LPSKARLEKLKLKVTAQETQLDASIGSLKEKSGEFSKRQDSSTALDHYLEALEKAIDSANDLILAYRSYSKELEKHVSEK
jgi:hypothetical protein